MPIFCAMQANGSEPRRQSFLFSVDSLSGGGGGTIRSTIASPKTDFAIIAKKIEARELTDTQIHAIAVILNKRWSRMEKDASVEKYVEELNWIRKNDTQEKRSTPVFVAENNGVIGAALIAQRVNKIPSKYSQLIGVDEPDGTVLVCRRITTDPDDERFSKAPRMLIAGEALSYAKGLYEKGELTDIIAYSRFGNYGEFLKAHPRTSPEIYLFTTCEKDKEEPAIKMQSAYPIWLAKQWGTQGNIGLFLKQTGRKHADGTVGMHLSFGATIHRLMPNACPEDTHAQGFGVLMSYTHLLTGKEPKDAAFLDGRHQE